MINDVTILMDTKNTIDINVYLATFPLSLQPPLSLPPLLFLAGLVGGGKLQSAGHGRVAAMVGTIPSLLDGNRLEILAMSES